MARFLAVLDAARRMTNLTGPLPSEELVDHALESALGADLLPVRARIVDIGSGGGFPGLPLAIVRPDVTIVPVEPRRRRAAFLERAAREESLDNVQAPHRHLRDLPPASADVATARAVADVDRLVRDAAWLTPEGLFLAWTTEPDGLAGRLEGAFRLDRTVAVPGSRRKVIAALRRIPRSTGNTPHRKRPATG